MSGEKNLNTLIASMKPILIEHEYVFTSFKTDSLEQVIKLAPISTFQEEEGLTAVIKKDKADEHAVPYSGTFRCITLSVHSSLDAVGLTAAVATKLTKANISANVIAAYYHDHVFVASKDAQSALTALNELVHEGNAL